MAKYASQSRTGFNASPPSDDGAATESNRTKWSDHVIDKVGTPITDQIDAIQSQLATAFGRTFLDAVSAQTGNFSVGAGDWGTIFTCTNSITATLLAAATATDGFTVTIYNNGSGTVTIDGATSETINGETTLIVPPEYGATLVCNGTTWFAIYHVPHIVSVTDFSAMGNFFAYTGSSDPDGNRLALNGTAGITEATWETIGPTGGSGNDYTWTFLDDIPSHCKALEVTVSFSTGTTTGMADLYVFFRPDGSSSWTTIAPGPFGVELNVDLSDAAAHLNVVPRVLVPLDSAQQFEVNWGNTTATNEVNIVPTGFWA